MEKTFARKESQREFLQIWRLGDKGLRNASTEKSGKHSREKVSYFSSIIIMLSSVFNVYVYNEATH